MPGPPGHHYPSSGGYDDDGMSHARHHSSMSEQAESSVMGGSGSKYECTYCGKGFTRPSSLKVSIDAPRCWSWSVLLIMEFLSDSCE